MKWKSCSVLVANLALSMSMAGIASAQSASAEDSGAKARVHFDRGVNLYREGSLDAALGEFTRAYDLTHDFRLLYNIAQVQAERHDYAAAIDIWTEYLSRGGAAVPKERRLEVDGDLARIRQRVAELWISTNTDGGEVWIGSHMAGKLPLTTPILVNAGQCVVRITQPGYKPVTRELRVTGGDRPRLEVELELEREATPASPAVERPVRNNTWLGVSLVATGALAVGSGVFAVLADKANNTLDARLNTFPSDRANIDAARNNLRIDAIVCDALAGAAVLAAGASLYFFLNPKYEPSTKSAAATPALSARLVASPTGLWLNGRF